MHVARITIWPVAGLGGHDVEAARVLPSGALENDRRWRLVDVEGRPLGGLALRRLRAVRAEIDPVARTIGLSIAGAAGAETPGIAATFPLRPGPEGPCPWLSRVAGVETFLEERPEGGFPPDPFAPGPLLAATASLEEVRRWFGSSLVNVRGRLAVGVELGGVDGPFWEDTLACPARHGSLRAEGVCDDGADPWGAVPPPEPGSVVIGGALLTAVGVRELGEDTAVDPDSDRPREHFREIFEAWRRRTARPDVDTTHWPHRYRFAVATVGDGRGGEMRVGDRCVPVAHLGRS